MNQKNIILDRDAIMELIPHRDPFLLIDGVDQIVAGESARGAKQVTGEEYYFPGHFPGHPIMPGVLIVEAMAQTAAVLIAHTNRDDTKGKLVYFTGIDKARFRAPVRPGDLLHFEVRVAASRGMLFKMEGRAKVGDKLMADALFAAMIVDPEA